MSIRFGFLYTSSRNERLSRLTVDYYEDPQVNHYTHQSLVYFELWLLLISSIEN